MAMAGGTGGAGSGSHQASKSTPGELYCLALRVAATHTEALGARRDVHDAVIAMVVSLADRFEEALAPAELTMETLAEAEATAGLLHALAGVAAGPWQLAAAGHQVGLCTS
jgi:nuclear pore complex protein Nup188